MQILDLPVPQTVDYVLDALRFLDVPIAEQVIEVPKISCSPCPSRSLVPEPQSAEQLVEVPTVLSPTRIALRIAEQIVATPVPRGRGQGSLPRQTTTATHSSGKRISKRIVEQIVDFPEQTVEQIVDISRGGGLGQGSASSAGAADEDFTGGFRTFPRGKKSARAAASPSAELGEHVSSSTLGAHQMARAGDRPWEVSSWTPAAYGETIGSDEWVQFSRRGKPFYWNRRSHETFWTPPEGVKVVWIGEQTATGRGGGVGTGTRKRVSVLMTSHRFLLADWSRGEGRGIPSPHLGCHTRRRLRRHAQG